MNRPKCRLLVITQLFLPTKGGTTVWFSEVYPYLGGKEIHIVTQSVPGGDEIDRSHPNRIHRLRLERRPWLRPESLVIYLKLLAKSLAVAFSHRFQAVHAARALPEGLVAWAVARLRGLPVLIYGHGEEFTTWGRGLKYKVMCWTLRHADVLIANSDYSRDLMLAMGVPAERLHLVYPGVNLERFRPGLPCADLREGLGLGPGARLILSVGRLQRRKGFDQVIRSLPHLVDKGLDAHLALIGIGEDEAYLRGLSEELGVSGRVHFLGHVDSADLPRWYNACDCFAMPNREVDGDTEGFGMVFVEAAACAKPVVAGEAGGTAAAVIDGETGLRVAGEDRAAVSAALERILSDRDLARALGEGGLTRARRELGWERVARQTRALHPGCG